jgi:hypothetical protein
MPVEDQFQIRDLLADSSCSLAVLDFLSTTDVGRRVPALAEKPAQSETSEWELREREEGQRRGGERPRSWVLRTRGGRSFPHTLLDGICGRGVGGVGAVSFVFPL